MGNGLEKKENSRADVYQLQQMRGSDDYDNEGNKSTDRLMDIKARKTNTTSFLRPPLTHLYFLLQDDIERYAPTKAREMKIK